MSDQWRVEHRGEPPADGEMWDWSKDGPDSWRGEWLPLGVTGSEDYCRGYVDAAERREDRACWLRCVPDSER